MGERKLKARKAAGELYPGHAKDLADRNQRNRRRAAANSVPLPGPLLDAFAHVPQTVAGRTVRALVHFDFVILQKLASPLLAHLRGGTKQATAYTDEQGYEMVYQFTRPVREIAAEIAREGRDFAPKFKAAALETIGLSLGPVEVGLLVQAVEREFIRAFSTRLGYEARPGEPGQVFTTPPPAPTTASAGGSTTSER